MIAMLSTSAADHNFGVKDQCPSARAVSVLARLSRKRQSLSNAR